MLKSMIAVIINVLLFHFALWLPSSVSLSGCPYNVKGCSCSSHKVDCYNLRQFPDLQEKPYTDVVTGAAFWEGSFTDFPSKSLPEDLKRISFYETPITNVADDAFQNCASTLEELDFSLTSLTSLPSALRHLPNLTYLVIESSPIVDWDNITLQSLSETLQTLVFSNVNLTTWPKWLSSFTSLTSLDLSYNNFSSIPEDAFKHRETTPVLLNLSKVGLTQLSSEVSSLVNSSNLRFDRNMLTDANNRSWIEQMNKLFLTDTLMYLVLDSVGLTAIPDLTGLAGLRTISLGCNKITEINSNKFPQNISSIDLSNNKITAITDACFQRCWALDTLALNHNPISTVSPSAFTSLVNLKNLFFSNSLIQEFPQSLSSLEQLQYIDLSGAPLECTCPIKPNIVKFFESFQGTFIATCVDGREFREYVYYSCRTTRTLTMTTTGEATTLASHTVHTSVCLASLLFIWHYFS